MLEPLGESQVLQYAKALSENYGHSFTILSFEKSSDLKNKKNVERINSFVHSFNGKWIPLTYHKSPTLLATLFDIATGTLLAIRLNRKKKFHFLHTRSYVSALIGLLIKITTKTPFIFDMRGFWADEKVDTGSWSKGVLYKSVKWLEKQYLIHASAVISLSKAGIKEMMTFDYLDSNSDMKKFHCVSTCTNLDNFSISKKKPAHPLTLGYVGNAQGWYMFEPVLEIYQILLKRDSNSKFEIVNQNDHEYIRNLFKKKNTPLQNVTIQSLTHDQVPSAISQMDFTAFFIKPFYSKIASAPTKLGEFLAMGIPCLTGPGIGDVEEILNDFNSGLVVHSNESLNISFEKFLEIISSSPTKENCRKTAEKYFSLERGVFQYNHIYKNINTDLFKTQVVEEANL